MKKSALLLSLFLLIFPHTFCHSLYAADQQGDELSVVTDFRKSSNSATNTVYYISTSGNDNANGLTPSKAWKTVSKVNSSTFLPGDSILFKRGNMWNDQLVIPSSGTPNGYITFGAYGSGKKPVLNGNGLILPRNQGLIEIHQNKEYVIIENFRIINAGIGHRNDNSGINFAFSTHGIIRNCETYKTEASGIRVHASHNILIDSNNVELACLDSLSESITIAKGTYNFEVKDNIVHHNGQPKKGGSGIDAKNGSHDGKIHHNEIYAIQGATGIYADAYKKHTYNIEIYSNYIHDFINSTGIGISVSSEQGGLLENIKVHHNIISNIKIGMNMHPGRKGLTDPIKNIFIYNNTIYNCGPVSPSFQGGLILRNPDSKNIHIKNNIFSQNLGFQVGFSNIDGTIPISQFHINHNVFDGDINTPNVKTINGVSGYNPIIASPQFISTSNLRLRAGSPAKNACDSSVWKGTPNISDFDGIPITDSHGNIVAPGGRVSCGAYE